MQEKVWSLITSLVTNFSWIMAINIEMIFIFQASKFAFFDFDFWAAHETWRSNRYFEAASTPAKITQIEFCSTSFEQVIFEKRREEKKISRQRQSQIWAEVCLFWKYWQVLFSRLQNLGSFFLLTENKLLKKTKTYPRNWKKREKRNPMFDFKVSSHLTLFSILQPPRC